MPFRAVILAVICQFHTEEIWVERWPAVCSGHCSLFLGFRRTGGLLSVKVEELDRSCGDHTCPCYINDWLGPQGGRSRCGSVGVHFLGLTGHFLNSSSCCLHDIRGMYLSLGLCVPRRGKSCAGSTLPMKSLCWLMECSAVSVIRS